MSEFCLECVCGLGVGFAGGTGMEQEGHLGGQCRRLGVAHGAGMQKGEHSQSEL